MLEVCLELDPKTLLRVLDGQLIEVLVVPREFVEELQDVPSEQEPLVVPSEFVEDEQLTPLL
jgi:hypothetical protein